MVSNIRNFVFFTIATGVFLAAVPTHAQILVSGNFGPNGDLGFVNSPSDLSISFGADGQGSIYQMDGFVNVAGENLNNTGSGFGTSADLSYGAPSGLAYSFSATQPTADELLLTYSFTNNTGGSLPGFQFLYLVDPDIGPNYADEWAPTGGALGSGETFQVGDPSESTIFTNLLYGTLNDADDFGSSGTTGDVSMGLAFNQGALAPGEGAQFEVLLSDDGSQLGNFAITQHDPVYTGDTLTVSAKAVPAAVPEPGDDLLALVGVGIVAGIAAGRIRRVADWQVAADAAASERALLP